MDRARAEEYLRENHRGVLATLTRDGRPQLSHVAYLYDADGRVRISVTDDRAKTRNVRRDPRVALSVIGDDWYEYVVAEGAAAIVEAPEALALLRHVYEGVSGGPHPDWEEFDAAMVRDRRVVLQIEIERLYPIE